MKKALPLLSLALLAVIVFAVMMRDTGEINVLVFSKTEQFRHESIEAGVEALRALGREHGFRVDATEEASAFTEASLQAYNVVVFLNTTGDVLNDGQQLAFNRFIQAGGGFVGIHAAADTEYDWSWYGALVGAYFQSHPNDPNVREGVLHRATAGHPATAHLDATWTHTDEWYDYQTPPPPDATILLNVDETSYKRAEENPSTDLRPIAWARPFDGGHMFYTGLGHTAEAYSSVPFLEHLWGGIQYAAGDRQPINYDLATVAPEENRFKQTVLVRNLTEPMELDLLGPGRIIFVERGGAVKIHDEAAGTTETIHTFDVFSDLEEGLIGVAVDPDYATTNWVYFNYSAPDTPEIRVARFVLEGNRLDVASEKVLLRIPVQRDECCHVAGSLEFDGQGNLFISVGDNTNPFASDGFAPIDEREGRSPWDAQKSSANMDDLRGKILRIAPQDDGTYTIPDGNLFPKDGSGGRPEIYVMGNRNPFRMSIDPHTGYLYWGEIGPDAGTDSTGRGPKGHDEVNQARQAGFFGWPYFVGDNKPYHDYDFATQTSGPAFDPANPINTSPNNTGGTNLPPAQPAFIWYPYGPSDEFPLVGEGGRNAMAGPVYYYDDYADAEAKFPAYFDGKLFIYEWMRGWFMAVTMDANGDFERMEPFLPSSDFSNPTDMLFAPDGTMYLLEYGPLWFSGSPEAKLSHITYIKGNRAPLAEIAADQTLGAAPLTIAFSSTSLDYDGDDLTYAWDFGNGETSREINPTATYTSAGTYNATLTVTDAEGLSNTSQLDVLVGNDVPEVSLVLAGNRSFYWDSVPVQYSVQVTDTEDGSLASGSIATHDVTLTIDYLAEGTDLVVPAMGHAAAMEASLSLVGKSLIDNATCSACHQPEAASVGPSYQAVAERYADDALAIERLAAKIINGGGGVWGDQAMAAHPHLTVEEAEKMVEYIMSFGDNQTPVDSEPLEGTFRPTEHIGQGDAGTYILMASYTDKGTADLGPLTSRDVVTLRSPRIAMKDFDDALIGTRFTVPEDAPGGFGGTEVFLGQHGAQATYRNLDLTDVGSLTATFIVAPTYTTGGTVEIRLGSADGQLLGTVSVEQGLTTLGPQDHTISLPDLQGLHDLVFVYSNADASGLVCVGHQFELNHTSQARS